MFFNSIKEINSLRKEINKLLSKGLFLIQSVCGFSVILILNGIMMF